MTLGSMTRKEFIKKCSFIFTGALIDASLLSALTPDTVSFSDKLKTLHWITYAPTNFNPNIGKFPTESSLRQDFRLLQKYGFNGVLTYASDGTLYNVPKIAKEAGFKGAIMGIWNPISSSEKNNAASQKRYVDGYIIGNEGLWVRYDFKTLSNAINSFKNKVKKPVSTTQQIDHYYTNEHIIMLGDWLCPNAHPYWHNIKEPQRAAEWTRNEYQKLTRLKNSMGLTKKIILFKEVGLPSSGDFVCNETNQKMYYKALLAYKDVEFSVFEAFDQNWKDWAPVEPHWGVFRADRKPKPTANYLRGFFKQK
ncbi:hypothetical protein JW756_00660 [Candidatus Woesearchaeota archaeon]|nr:hypothetical protein [Candidatus Woesearchaeota archaeon]